MKLHERIDVHTHYLPPAYGSDGTFTPQPLCRKFAEAMDNALKGDLAKIYLDNPENLFAW